MHASSNRSEAASPDGGCTQPPSGDAASDRSAVTNAPGSKSEKAEDRRYKTLQESLKKMAIELKEHRAEIQNQVTELASDVKGILAAITVPAVGFVNAAPTKPLVRQVFESQQPYQPSPPSSCWACGQLGHFSRDCPSVGPPRPPTRDGGRGGDPAPRS